MPQEVYADRDDYTIEIDDDLGAIIHTWNQFVTGDDFRDGANVLLEAIQEEDKSKLIVDVSGIKAHDEADKQWLQEKWIPKTIEAGIDYSVTIHADSVISEMEMDTFSDQASDLPFTYVIASDMAEAREWLAEQ